MKNNTRFSICLLFLWMSMNFCLAAETYSQETFFTIESNNLTVKEVFNKIEKETDHHLERRKSRSGQFTTKRTNHHRYRKRCDRRTGHRSQYRRKRNDQRYDYRHERTVHPHR